MFVLKRIASRQKIAELRPENPLCGGIIGLSLKYRAEVGQWPKESARFIGLVVTGGGFDYQANTEVYIIYTMKLGVVVWYKHDSYAGKLCPDCPKLEECRETLDAIMTEYNITLRPDEEELYMTEQSIAIFNKLAAKEVPRYKRG